MINTCGNNCKNCGNCVFLNKEEFLQRYTILHEKPGKEYYCPKKDAFMNPSFPGCVMYIDEGMVVIGKKQNGDGFQRVHKHSVNR